MKKVGPGEQHTLVAMYNTLQMLSKHPSREEQPASRARLRPTAERPRALRCRTTAKRITAERPFTFTAKRLFMEPIHSHIPGDLRRQSTQRKRNMCRGMRLPFTPPIQEPLL